MEPEVEDAESSEILEPWSGSDGSQELYVSELYNEGDFSDAEYPSGQESPHLPKSDPESPQCLASQEWELTQEQQPVHELSGTEDDVSYREEDDIYLSESRGSITESPQAPTSPTSLSPPPECPDPESHADQIPQLRSSSSAIGCLADMTLALTLRAEQPQGASNRHGPRTGNRRVESSEEGGSSEAPPASVFFGISNEGAEQAEKWNSESDTDLCRRDRHRARCTRLSRNESQSERHVKETKSKCKRIARLLTDAPNPQNKGALLFNRRRQRVKKFTLVSYGTGENEFDSQDQIEEEEEEEEVRTAGYNFIATSDSELEEEYSVYQQQCNLSLNWARAREMEALPETKGKGVLMFAQRRQRMDEIALEHEELRGKGLPVEPLREPECAEEKDIYDDKEMYMHTEQGNYMDANIPEMNHHTNVPKPLVPNRTAKPFLGGQASPTAPAMPGGNAPAAKKPDLKFKVPVPINTNPHVWSPTSDIIASRDERIAVPAIKTGILPESKRKSNNKQQPARKQESDPHLQNKGDRRSYIESEEDCFSLGAEACNFMQPKTVKLKNPPPVAPKPTINPMCPPWMRSSFGEPYVPPRSPVSQPSPVGPQGQHYLQQQEWAPPQQMAGRWAPDQAQAMLQTPAGAWAPIGSPSQLHLQPTANSWSQQSPRSPVSMQARSPTYSPHHSPLPSKNKSESTQNSVASCPPQAGKSYPHASRAPQASPMGRGVSRSGGGGAQSMMGKGAELFAKRQSRMEKFVVDSETVQSNKTRTPSPTSSLPNSWRYSSNVRAPPPLSYNPLLSPFYPAAAKQAPSTSPKIKPKTKEKPKAPPKHLNALDIMKHQPYQLDTSLFTYDAFAEAKSPSPKPTPQSKFEVTKNLKQRFAPSKPSHVSEVDSESKPEVSLKAARLVSALNFSDRQNTKPAEPVAIDEQLDEKLTALLAANHVTTKQAQSVRPASSASQRSSTDESIASAFSPASLIARGVRQMAPRPKFSAKKPVVTTKQWKSVAMTN